MGGGSGSGSGAIMRTQVVPIDTDQDGAGNKTPQRGWKQPLHTPTPTIQTDKKQEAPPPGFRNWGNTCYANAALQCVMATALPHALMDPKASGVFRRFSSNHSLLRMGSGSVDENDNDDHLPPQPNEDPLDSEARDHLLEERQRRREEKKRKRLSRIELRRREQEQQTMHETSSWLTRELTVIALKYTSGPEQDSPSRGPPENPPQDGSIWSLLGLPPSPPPPKPSSDVLDPGSITRHPQRLSPCLQPYQQEDAHEFLRAMISTLVMNGHNRKLSSLFDGLLESAVTCQTCRTSSLTRDRYMDLSFDISHTHITDLPGALREFTKTEMLDEDNLVHCNRCDTHRQVSKGLRLATAPTTLVCHFKRFAYDQNGNMVRLNKMVHFPLKLEIGDYMSRANQGTPPPYGLVGVLVHQGRSCDSGHYLAYVKSSDGTWYKVNDSVVTKVDVATVLQQRAYILMYEVLGMREQHGYRSYNRYHSPPATPTAKAPPPPPTTAGKADSSHDDGSFSFNFMQCLNMCGSNEALSNFCDDADEEIVVKSDSELDFPKPTNSLIDNSLLDEETYKEDGSDVGLSLSDPGISEPIPILEPLCKPSGIFRKQFESISDEDNATDDDDIPPPPPLLPQDEQQHGMSVLPKTGIRRSCSSSGLMDVERVAADSHRMSSRAPLEAPEKRSRSLSLRSAERNATAVPRRHFNPDRSHPSWDVMSVASSSSGGRIKFGRRSISKRSKRNRLTRNEGELPPLPSTSSPARRGRANHISNVAA